MRAPHPILLALVLMVFQAQVLAASTLGCLHQNGVAGVGAGVVVGTGIGSAVCPHHVPASPDLPEGASTGLGALDCVKCALALGLHALPAAGGTSPGELIRPPMGAEPSRHFYSLVPESPLRPPIPVLA